MLAPFFESIFKDVFERIEEGWARGGSVRNILGGANKKGMAPYLPDQFAPTIEALFRYRNDLFHWGFEWPAYTCRSFESAKDQWPNGWFNVACQNLDPWMFSMSEEFINHCLEVAEDVTAGLGDFLVDEERERNGLPRLGRGKDDD